VVEAPGRGVSGIAEGHRIAVGARSLLEERQPEATGQLRDLEARFVNQPGLRAYVAIDGRAAGVVEYADRVRDDAHEVMTELRRIGVNRTMMLSGDHPANVTSVAAEIGLSDARADLLPEGKVAVIRDLIASGERVLMVGDGTNDAPALSAATVGMAIAAHGGGITAEAADVVLLADDLRRVPEAIRISRRTLSVARQSIIVGLGLSALAMVFAAFGFIRPAVGALLQEAIDVAVILNALRTSR
jgi:P-type E1-E2 ATPase